MRRKLSARRLRREAEGPRAGLADVPDPSVYRGEILELMLPEDTLLPYKITVPGPCACNRLEFRRAATVIRLN